MLLVVSQSKNSPDDRIYFIDLIIHIKHIKRQSHLTFSISMADFSSAVFSSAILPRDDSNDSPNVSFCLDMCPNDSSNDTTLDLRDSNSV